MTGNTNTCHREIMAHNSSRIPFALIAPFSVGRPGTTAE